MSEFEQMMAEINVPEEIARQVAESAKNGDVLKVWERLAPIVDTAFEDCSTASGICAVGMLLAYVGDQLSKTVKFGKTPEDEGENVHPNFCVMAIALLAVNTLKASKAAQELGDGDDEEKTEGQEEGQEEGSQGDQAGGNSKQAANNQGGS